MLIAYRSNPHWDLAPTGFRAGNRLIRALRGQISPVAAWRKLPLVLGGGTTIDFLPPMRGVFRWMRERERDARVLSASLFMVHPYTTAEDLGWAAHVSTDGDRALAERLADELAERAWEQRKVAIPEAYSVDEALARAKRSPLRRLGPVTLVDGDDIVGAGAPGGNTRIVLALARDDRGLVVYVPVHDPALVAELWAEPEGTRRRVVLRGTPGYGQPEVELDVTVGPRAGGEPSASSLPGMSRTLRLDVAPSRGGRVHVAVSERSPLPIHPSFWRALGLDARKADVIVQKNFFHYRMFYLAISFEHLLVKTDGATSLERVRTARYRLPTYPGTPLESWRGLDPVLRRGARDASSP